MYPNFLYQYALELQREREKELLNLAEDERLVRKAKPVKNSHFTLVPKLNLYKVIQTIGRNLPRTKKMAAVTANAGVCTCTSCESLQQQVC